MNENNVVYLDSLCEVEISMKKLEFYLNVVMEDYNELIMNSRDLTKAIRASIMCENLKLYLDEVKSILEQRKRNSNKVPLSSYSSL